MASTAPPPPHPAARTAAMSVVAAGMLVVIKLVAGVASGSLALIAEAVHSVADMFAAALTWVAVRVGARPPDARHHWGHGRAEHLAALGEAALLVVATGIIVREAVLRLAGEETVVDASGWVIAVVGVVIVVDIARMLASMRAAKVHASPALASNAVHFASDLGGSIAVLAGLAAVRAGLPAGDAIAALIVAAIVLMAAVRLAWTNAQVLMDVAPPGAEAAAREAIAGVSREEPMQLRRLRVRRSAGTHHVDAVIGVSATDHVAQGHAIADAVEAAVRERLAGADVTVHVEPDQGEASTLRDRVTAAALARPGIHEVHNVVVLLVDGSVECSLHLKVRGDLPLARAHARADEVEAAVREAVPEMRHVTIHVEPVERDATETTPVLDDDARAAAEAAVVEVTGAPPRELRLRPAPKGLTAFVTVVGDPAQTLREAHDLATRVEQRICAAVPRLVEAVVHVEPADER